jgi:hypothetical protein
MEVCMCSTPYLSSEVRLTYDTSHVEHPVTSTSRRLPRKPYSKRSCRRLPLSILAHLLKRMRTRHVGMAALICATADLLLLGHGLDQVMLMLHQARRFQGCPHSLSKSANHHLLQGQAPTQRHKIRKLNTLINIYRYALYLLHATLSACDATLSDRIWSSSQT